IGRVPSSRGGRGPLNDAADVSPERLRRFFNAEGDFYRVRREIREMILFATHNFLKDPPFSHLDMISCRNVMIYLNNTAQERVLGTFHFALRPGGILFLGSAESADNATDFYLPLSREFHMFQSRHVTIHSYPVPESVPNLAPRIVSTINGTPPDQTKTRERITFSDLHQRLLEEYAPPSIVFNEQYNIVHLSERAGRYLQIGGGELSQNLMHMVREELRLELRSGIYQALQRQAPVEIRDLIVTIADQPEKINLHIRPVFRLGDATQGLFLIVFDKASEPPDPGIVLTSHEPVAKQLEEELNRIKAHLRASTEQYEFQAEELKASNEELQAMNEELRSAAEE
ncbi:MAG: histidine kinase, partial [Sphingobacteriales bacterium]